MKSVTLSPNPVSLRLTAATALLLFVATFFSHSLCQAFTNPVYDYDRPDPSVIYHDGNTWMTHTMGSNPPAIPLHKGTNLTGDWSFQNYLVTSSNEKSWMGGPYWAPEVHRVQSQQASFPLSETESFKYVAAFSSWYSGGHSIGLGHADSITGPYTFPDQPLVEGEVIDPHIFQDYDGKKYLFWHQGTFQLNSIRGRELNAECTAFASGSSEQTLISPTESWESGNTEGPWVIRRGNYYYLLYSGNHFNTDDYAVGVARSSSPLGPYTKFSGNPILQKNSTFTGPGHGAVIRDAEGDDWYYYHGYHASDPDAGRVQFLDKIVYDSQGWPGFGNGGTPSTTTQQNAPVFDSDDPPTCYVAAPSDGATIDGSAILSAGASDDSDVLEVVFYYEGPSNTQYRIGNAQPTIYGWVVSWDTTTMANGSYDIFATATDTYGHMTESDTIEVHISN